MLHHKVSPRTHADTTSTRQYKTVLLPGASQTEGLHHLPGLLQLGHHPDRTAGPARHMIQSPCYSYPLHPPEVNAPTPRAPADLLHGGAVLRGAGGARHLLAPRRPLLVGQARPGRRDYQQKYSNPELIPSASCLTFIFQETEKCI